MSDHIYVTDQPPTPPVTVEAILNAIDRIIPPDPRTYATVIRMNNRTLDALRTQIPPPAYTTGAIGSLFSLSVRIDDTLPDGVWRTYNAAGDLLHDSRTKGQS